MFFCLEMEMFAHDTQSWTGIYINFQICQCFFLATVSLYTVYCAVNIGLSTTFHFLYSTGRYLFLNAIANQLHYPNSHTTTLAVHYSHYLLRLTRKLCRSRSQGLYIVDLLQYPCLHVM